ncbi:hypothetical protein U9M48_018941, partial [Paspalum notatum var. saurae]
WVGLPLWHSSVGRALVRFDNADPDPVRRRYFLPPGPPTPPVPLPPPVAGAGVAVGGSRVELSFLLFNFLALLLCKQGTVHQAHGGFGIFHGTEPSLEQHLEAVPCIRDPLLIIAPHNVKPSLHRTEPVIRPKRIGRMGESRWMSLHKVSTSVPPLRLRIGLNILRRACTALLRVAIIRI